MACWHAAPSSDCVLRVHRGVLLQTVGAGRTGAPSRSCWSAAGALFNLFHGNVVVVARAKFWLSYLRTKLCNSPSFPAPSPCVSPHVPLSQGFLFCCCSLSGFGKCVCLTFQTHSALSRCLVFPPALFYFCRVLRLLIEAADRKRLSFSFSQSLQSPTRCYVRGGGWSTSALALHALCKRCCCAGVRRDMLAFTSPTASSGSFVLFLV